MGFVLFFLGVVVVSFFVILLIYYCMFRSVPGGLHDPDLSFKEEYEKHCCKQTRRVTQDLTFQHFLNLYQINPEKWRFFNGETYGHYGHYNDDYRLYYWIDADADADDDDDDDDIQVIFSKKDYIKFRKWNGKRIFARYIHREEEAKYTFEKQSSEACRYLLADVQKDIDKSRDEAQAQIDQAKEITKNIAITLDM